MAQNRPVTSNHGWTIEEAAAQFAATGIPFDPARLRLAIRAIQLTPIGETAPGDHGGRGYALYEIGQLQRLHSALAPWLTAAKPGDM